MTRYMPAVVRLMKKTVDAEPDDVEARFNLACALAELSRFREAADQLDLVLDDDPGHEAGNAYLLRGLCYARLRRHDDAIESFESAMKHGAPIADTYVQIAHAHVAKKDFVQAESSLQEAIEQSAAFMAVGSKASLLWGEVGKVRFDAGDVDGSDAAFYRAAQYAPKSVDPWRQRARFYLEREETERAKRCVERARRISSDDPDLLLIWAQCLVQDGNEAEALELVRDAPAAVRSLIRRRPTLYWMLEEEEE